MDHPERHENSPHGSSKLKIQNSFYDEPTESENSEEYDDLEGGLANPKGLKISEGPAESSNTPSAFYLSAMDHPERHENSPHGSSKLKIQNSFYDEPTVKSMAPSPIPEEFENTEVSELEGLAIREKLENSKSSTTFYLSAMDHPEGLENSPHGLPILRKAVPRKRARPGVKLMAPSPIPEEFEILETEKLMASLPIPEEFENTEESESEEGLAIREKHENSKPSTTFYLSDYMKICVPLYNAAINGDWHAAEKIIRDRPNVIKMSITKDQDTVLHIVASTKHTHFAKRLVERMQVEDLELQNKYGETALWIAVASTVEMVKILLKKNNGLLKIRKQDNLPILCAVWYGNKDLVEYIFDKTNLDDEKWNISDQKQILSSCLAFGLLDIALKIIKHYNKDKYLTIEPDVLKNLANQPSAFDETLPLVKRLLNSILPGPGPSYNSKAVEIVRIMWEKIKSLMHEDIVQVLAGGPNPLLFTAARLGNYKFIIELLKLYPDITWEVDDNKHTIFHVAVMHRQENVYKLVYELGPKKLGYMNDKDGNNILHLAAKKPILQSRVNIVSGAALQMQGELLWFKEVENIMSSVQRTRTNKQGKSPQELFTNEHTELMEKGERWMKETAAQCMVVAALIATIMFAAALTLPGGSNGDNGQPIFKNKSAFTVFVVTDAISLCTSSASILMFLAILTSRYTEKDFRVSLPVKLVVGLLTLLISIATMMTAFTASFFLLYAKSMKWIPVLVAGLAVVTVMLFVVLQYHLLVDMIRSMYNSRHLFRPKKRMLV